MTSIDHAHRQPALSQDVQPTQLAPQLRTSSLRMDDEAVLVLAGEFDLSDVGQVCFAAAECLGGHPARLAIDLGAVTFCDCSALRALRSIKAHADADGVSFRVLGCETSLRRVLLLSGSADLLAACEGGTSDRLAPHPASDVR